MADEEDETFPPEAQKQPTEFAFREFGCLFLTTNNNESILNVRNSLLAAANTYGLLFVGYPAGYKVYNEADVFAATKEKGTSPNVVVDVPLRSSPHWLAVSSDNLTLVVCCSGEKGLQALFFDTRNLVNKAKPTKTPFHVLSLSKSSTDTVSSLHWNPSPDTAHYLAICVSSGTFHMLSITDSVQEVGQKPVDFGACSVCWSPRGKQVMIGKADGSLQQYTPSLEIRRTVPPYDVIEKRVKVADVLWLSTLQVAFSYVPITDDGDWQPSLFVVNLPPVKETSRSPSFRNYEDPCYGEATARPPHLMMPYIDKWGLFVLASSHGSETAVIGKDKQKEVWEIWNLDDSCRAQLPIRDGDEEPFPLGCAIIYSAEERIVVDDTRECGAMPVLAMLSCDGCLSLFHMINLLSTDDYPNIIIPPKQLTTDGERSAVVNKLGSADGNKGFLPVGKTRLSSKPSMFATTSTPKQPREQGIESVQLTMTPLRGGFSPANVLDSTIKLAPKTLGFPSVSSLSTNKDAGDSNKQVTQRVLPKEVLSGFPNTTITDENKALRKSSLEKSFNPPQGRNNSASPAPGNPATEPFAKQPSRPASASTISGSSIASAKTSAAQAKDLEAVPLKRRVARKSQDKSSAINVSADSSIMDGLVNEVMDFERELDEYFQESSSVEDAVASLGSQGEKMELITGVSEMTEFQREIIRASKDHHEEVQSIRSLSLEAYAALQNVETQRKRVENPAYRDALYAKPLDMSDQRRMRDIRGSYQYVRDTIKEVNNVLDDQWMKFMERQKSTALRKSKRRKEMDEQNTIRQAISNQTKIIHDQELKLLLLNQQLDRLRLNNTSLHFPDHELLANKSASAVRQAGDSADLATMASSLIRKNQVDSPEKKPRDFNSSSNKNSSLMQISPQKASQLSDFLATKKSTTVRSTAGGRSRLLAKELLRRQPKAPPTDEVSKRSSSLTGDYNASSKDDTTSRDSSSDSGDGEDDELAYSARRTAHGHVAELPSSQLPNTSQMATPSHPPYHAISPVYDKPPVDKGQDARKQSELPSSQLPNTSQMATPSHPPYHAISPVYDKPPVDKGQDARKQSPPPQPTSREGYSTITYGGPDKPTAAKPTGRYDERSAQTEAASNLNNPPKVVNVKEMNEADAINTISLPQTFQAKPEVPRAVVNEVQRVLNTVQAARKQQSSSPLPTLSGGPSAGVGVPTNPKSEFTSQPTEASSFAATSVGGTPLGFPGGENAFSSSFVLKTSAQNQFPVTSSSPSTTSQSSAPLFAGNGSPFSSSFTRMPPPHQFASPVATATSQPIKSSALGMLTPSSVTGNIQGSGSYPNLFRADTSNLRSNVIAVKEASDGVYASPDAESSSSISKESSHPGDVPEDQRPEEGQDAPVSSSVEDSSPSPLEKIMSSTDAQSSSSTAPPAEPVSFSLSRGPGFPPTSVAVKSDSPAASFSKPEQPPDQLPPPSLNEDAAPEFGEASGEDNSSALPPSGNNGASSQKVSPSTTFPAKPGLFQIPKSSSASGIASFFGRASATPGVFHGAMASAPASLVSMNFNRPSVTNAEPVFAGPVATTATVTHATVGTPVQSTPSQPTVAPAATFNQPSATQLPTPSQSPAAQLATPSQPTVAPAATFDLPPAAQLPTLVQSPAAQLPTPSQPPAAQLATPSQPTFAPAATFDQPPAAQLPTLAQSPAAQLPTPSQPPAAQLATPSQPTFAPAATFDLPPAAQLPTLVQSPAAQLPTPSQPPAAQLATPSQPTFVPAATFDQPPAAQLPTLAQSPAAQLSTLAQPAVVPTSIATQASIVPVVTHSEPAPTPPPAQPTPVATPALPPSEPASAHPLLAAGEGPAKVFSDIPPSRAPPVFGAPTSSAPLFGSVVTSSGSASSGPASSGPSVFGAPPSFGGGTVSSGAPLTFASVPAASAGTTFGGQTTSSSAFNTAPATNSFSALATSTSSSGFGSASSGFGSNSGGFGGGFLSGLGSTPKQSSSSNPFAAEPPSQAANNSSLFGGSASSSFTSGFGQNTPSRPFGGNQAEAQKEGGVFQKPPSASFGSPAVFGSPSVFGAKPAFGAAPQFGGGATFGSPTAGFGNPATFGSQIGATTGQSTGGFGSGTGGFGSFANAGNTGFGALAEKSGGGFGSFGSQASFGGGFGSANQGAESANQGFGSTPAPSFGASTGSGFASAAPFGSDSKSKPSFSGWR